MLKLLLFIVSTLSSCLANFNTTQFHTKQNIKVTLFSIPSANTISLKAIVKNSGLLRFGKNITCLLSEYFLKGEEKDSSVKSLTNIAKENLVEYSLDFQYNCAVISFDFLKGQEDILIPFAKSKLFNITFDSLFELTRDNAIAQLELYSEHHENLLIKIYESEALNPKYHTFPVVKEIKALKTSEVEEAYKNLINKNDLHVVIAGNLSKDEAAEIVDQIFKDAHAKGRPVSSFDNVKKLIFNKAKKDYISIQSYKNYKILAYSSYKSNIESKAQEFIAFSLLSRVITGDLFKGLLHSLREKGLAYYVKVNVNRFLPLIILNFETKQYKKSKNAVLNFLGTMHKSGISRKEFNDEKTYIKNAIEVELAKPSDFTTFATKLISLGIEKDPIATVIKAINTLEFNTFNKLLTEFTTPSNFSFIIIH